jgi:hypothetical protein
MARPRPESRATFTTAAATLALTWRISDVDGKRLPAARSEALTSSARALAAAANMASVTSLASETRTPSPTPGKMNELLAWATATFRPAYGTGSNGLPVAMSARPSVHFTMSTGFASVLFVGLDIGKTTGRSTCLAISRTTASVKVSGSPDVPMRIVGLTALTTARRSRGAPFPRPIFAARAAGHAKGRLWTSLISTSSTTSP